MKLKKACAFLMCIVIIFTIHMPVAFAFDEVVVYSDFEDCIDTIKAPWKSQGHTTTAAVAQTERGLSAVLNTIPKKMLEIYCDFPKTDENVQTLVMRFAMKFEDSVGDRAIFSRNDTGEFALVSFPKGGGVSIGDATLEGITIERKVWYDMYLVYVPLTGEIRLSVDDGKNVKSGNGVCKVTGKTGLWRINFAAFKSDTESTLTYIDDVCVNTLDYVPNSFVSANGSGETHNFDDYVASDGVTAPTGWYFQNFEAGKAGGKSIESKTGRAIECRNDGSKNFEFIRNFTTPLTDKGGVEFDLKREPDSRVVLGIRARNSSNASKTKFLIEIANNGDVKFVGDESVICSLQENTWYRLGAYFNISEHTYTFTAESDGGSFSINSEAFPEDYVKITGFEFFTEKNKGASAFVVDNVFIGQKQEFGVSTVAPAFTTITALTDKIVLTYVGDADDVASNAIFTLNGDSSYFDGFTTDDDKIVLNLVKPLEYGKSYLFEAKNLGDNKHSASVVAPFLTQKRFCYTYHDVAVGSDAITATISAKSTDEETYDITLLLAIYNKETGEMIDLVATNSKFSGEQVNLSISAPIPGHEGSYEAYAYVWDGAYTMQSLIAPKILNIE